MSVCQHCKRGHHDRCDTPIFVSNGAVVFCCCDPTKRKPTARLLTVSSLCDTL
jgi:hypothetical protein